jgi:hypothetical protein
LAQIHNTKILQQYEYNQSEKDKQKLQKKIEKINYREQHVLNSSTKAIYEYKKDKEKLKEEKDLLME